MINRTRVLESNMPHHHRMASPQTHPSQSRKFTILGLTPSRTVQSAQKIHLYGPPELKERITRWNANGQHGTFAAARRYLRLLRSLVLNQVPYLDPQGRARNAAAADIENAARHTWTVLQNKWRAIPGGLDLILNPAHPLGFWRRVLKETHGIHLPERP